MTRVETWGPERSGPAAADVFAVYDAVFGDATEEAEWRSSTYERHLARPEFRLTAALDGERLVGFAYGYVGDRGQWWPDRVAAALPPDVAATWVGGHFEFVELAVLPAYRRQGLGQRLHDALLVDVPSDRALLGTEAADSPAVRLYRSRGWRTLGHLSPDVQVMGLRLGPG